MTIQIGKYMTAERLAVDPHDVYTIHARDKSMLGYAEWYPCWRRYVFHPDAVVAGVVLSWDCCMEMGKFLKSCNSSGYFCDLIFNKLEIIRKLVSGEATMEKLCDVYQVDTYHASDAAYDATYPYSFYSPDYLVAERKWQIAKALEYCVNRSEPVIIPIGKYMTAELLSDDPHDLYSIHARDKSILGYVEWYPCWRGYIFSPEADIALSWDCCMEMGKFLKSCNKTKKP